MSALTRIERMDDSIPDLFTDLFRRFMRAPDWLPSMPSPEEMKVDIVESDKAYVLKADIPGAKKEDVRVHIDDNFVNISAEIKEDKAPAGNGTRTLLHELHYGSMSRGFSMAQQIDEKLAQAKFENGILTLTLPKRPESQGTLLKIA
jgi:HSP20 family protein